MSLDEKISLDTINNEIDSKSDRSKISLITSQSIKSTTGIARQTSGLMTKTTLTAINKVIQKKLEIFWTKIYFLRLHVNVLHLILQFFYIF